jgi:phage terminase large subunit
MNPSINLSHYRKPFLRELVPDYSSEIIPTDMAIRDDLYQADPVGWAEDFLDVHLWSKQREVLESVFNNRRTVVRSCHSAGKTFTAAVTVLAFAYLKRPCKIVTTAPTWYQVTDLLWSEIRRLYRDRLEPKGFRGDVLTTRLRLSADHFATGISPNESVNFQGFHSENILVICDEAPGVDREVLEGAESLMASGNAHMLWIGNPTIPSGHFYDAFRVGEWERISISAYDTPSFTGEAIPADMNKVLISKSWVEEKKREWGPESALWASRILGVFPDSTDEQLISLHEVEQAVGRRVRPDGEVVMGVDVARFGSDETVILVRRGDEVLDIQSRNQTDMMEICGLVQHTRARFNVDRVQVDEIGLGAGVIDRLREMGVEAVGVNSARKAAESDKYFNLRTELWFLIKDFLQHCSLPDYPKLTEDLSAPQYSFTSRGQYRLEGKDDIKKRIGRSTDFGDALAIALYQPPPKAVYRMRKVRGI